VIALDQPNGLVVFPGRVRGPCGVHSGHLGRQSRRIRLPAIPGLAVTAGLPDAGHGNTHDLHEAVARLRR